LGSPNVQHPHGAERDAHVERRRRQPVGARREWQPAAKEIRRHAELQSGLRHRSADPALEREYNWNTAPRFNTNCSRACR
jgi:hypothetical protein